MNDLTLKEVKENFQLFENQLDKFEYLIEIGKNDVGLESIQKIDENLIIGCASKSWVVCNKEKESFYIEIDSEAHIVRGLLSILKVTINGKSKNEIFEIDGEKVLTEVGLGNSITSQRMNGFLSALDKVKKLLNIMNEVNNELIKVSRDCDAILIPGGEKVVLVEGTHVRITQALGGDYTVYVNGNLLKVSGKDCDAIGIESKPIDSKTESIKNVEDLSEQHVWDVLKTCYDPEIPVNIVDLGLIYDMKITKNIDDIIIAIKMTLTAPGCGMGPVIAQDVEDKLNGISSVTKVNVELVWEPAWNQTMMTDAARLELGML